MGLPYVIDWVGGGWQAGRSKLWRARSRLCRSQALQDNYVLLVFGNFCKIGTFFHYANIRNSAKNSSTLNSFCTNVRQFTFCRCVFQDIWHLCTESDNPDVGLNFSRNYEHIILFKQWCLHGFKFVVFLFFASTSWLINITSWKHDVWEFLICWTSTGFPFYCPASRSNRCSLLTVAALPRPAFLAKSRFDPAELDFRFIRHSHHAPRHETDLWGLVVGGV